MTTFVVRPNPAHGKPAHLTKAYREIDGHAVGPTFPFWVEGIENGASTNEPLRNATLEYYLRNAEQNVTPTKAALDAGQFYPGMWRGPDLRNTNFEAFPPVVLESNSLIASIVQLESLFSELENVFRVIEPNAYHKMAYGNQIRDILVLACTEAEAQWKGVLRAAHYKETEPKHRFTTTDYIKLCEPMRLKDYTVTINRYPALGNIEPFRRWSGHPHSSTKTLRWYHAYNAVKHDRQKNFRKASLFKAVEAVAACAIMLYAQYGPEALQIYGLKSFCHIYFPGWSPQDWYYCAPNDDCFEVLKYPF